MCVYLFCIYTVIYSSSTYKIQILKEKPFTKLLLTDFLYIDKIKIKYFSIYQQNNFKTKSTTHTKINKNKVRNI